jgi:hypothetical protein
VKYLLPLILLLTGCTTPAQWCVGACSQTNPITERDK